MITKAEFLNGLDKYHRKVLPAASGQMILDTVPATVDGGLWYEKSGTAPILWFHKGNYDYGYVNDKIRYTGDMSNKLVAYLPFNSSTTEDACGNLWTESGNPTITRDVNSFHGKALYLDGSSYLQVDDIASLLGDSAWTLDFWATAHDTSNERILFGAFNVNYGSSGTGTNYWVSMNWKGGQIELGCYYNDHQLNLGLTPNQRHHYAVTYDRTNLCVFVDGQRKLVLPHNIKLGAVFCIGCSPTYAHNFKGTIDHFRIHRKVLWTSDFTPPTANDYT